MKGKRRWDFKTQTTVDSSIEAPIGTPTTEVQQQTDKKPDSNTTVEKKKTERELKEKRVWELAQAPFKSLLMKAFLLWMSGNQIHIFPIIITVMALAEPLKSLLSTNASFEQFEKEGISVILPKIMFVILNSAGLGIAMAKCYWLGFFEGGAYQPVSIGAEYSRLLS